MIKFEPIVGHYLTVSSDGVDYRIYVEESGSGVPLFCLHTAGADSRQYRHLLNDSEVTLGSGSSRSISPGTAARIRQRIGGSRDTG